MITINDLCSIAMRITNEYADHDADREPASGLIATKLAQMQQPTSLIMKMIMSWKVKSDDDRDEQENAQS